MKTSLIKYELMIRQVGKKRRFKFVCLHFKDFYDELENMQSRNSCCQMKFGCPNILYYNMKVEKGDRQPFNI